MSIYCNSDEEEISEIRKKYQHYESAAVLDILEISKTYEGRDKSALKPICFSLNKGEIIGLAGKSGSGKSTLLKIIAGFLEPDDGLVRLNNKNILFPSQQLVAGNKDIKLVFQDFHLHPKTTVHDNIEIEVRKYGNEYAQKRIEYLLKVLKISHLEFKFPYELSGGEKQRVAIAKAIAEVPEVLILDEPFASLDPILRNELSKMLLELFEEEEVSVIIADHDVQSLLGITDKILVLSEGKLLSFDSPENTYNKPESAEIAQLTGEVTILEAAQANKLLHISLKNDEKVIIRPSQIKLAQNGIKAKVHKAIYRGYYYAIYCMIDNYEIIFYHNHALLNDIEIEISNYQIVKS